MGENARAPPARLHSGRSHDGTEGLWPTARRRYLKGRFPAAEAWQVSATGRKDYVTPGEIRVAPALALLGRLL
jgi:hypothetical protein